MEFREIMWELFASTGNLDAYLAYRACVCPDVCPSLHYQDEAAPDEQNIALNCQ